MRKEAQQGTQRGLGQDTDVIWREVEGKEGQISFTQLGRGFGYATTFVQ